jgi:inner membrane protein
MHQPIQREPRQKKGLFMTGTSHRLGGILAGLGTISLLQAADITSQGVILGAAVIGSLLPDIDNAQSTISYKVPLVRGIVGLMQGAIRMLSGLLPNKQRRYVRSLIGHRGITHSLVFAAAMPGMVLVAGRMLHHVLYTPYFNMAAWGIMAGVLSHILLDIFSNGVPLFLPFSVKRITAARIKTGGVAEWLVRIGIILLAGIILGPWFNEVLGEYSRM